MNFERLLEFRFLRDLTITFLVRFSGMSIQKTVQVKRTSIPQLFFELGNEFMSAYLGSRDPLFSDNEWLFPTDDGKVYLPIKFSQNVRCLLVQQGRSPKPCHPKRLHDDQYKAILALRFQYQRPKYQQIIACGLIGFQGLRPEEVAGMVKEDVDLEQEVIHLRETKSQEPQEVPIHCDLVAPLGAYLSKIETGAPLFIRGSKRQWTRKDVHHAVREVGLTFGIENMNPRRLRSTVAHELIASGVPLNIISDFLRHKDKATAPRHYTALNDLEMVRKTLNRFRPAGDRDDSLAPVR